jgi:hypothetical protein
MNEDERKWLESQLREFGSIPAFLEVLALTEPKELTDLRERIENGNDHPSHEDLHDYVISYREGIQESQILEHVAFCGKCLRQILEFTRLENQLAENITERHEKITLIEKLKYTIGRRLESISFMPMIHSPVRSQTSETKIRTYARGMDAVLSITIPRKGYIFALQCCENTEEINMIFPSDPNLMSQFDEGEEIKITGPINGPNGSHFLKAYWIRRLDSEIIKRIGSPNRNQRESGVNALISFLSGMNPEDWMSANIEYEVI